MSELVCKACGSRALTTTEATHNPTSGREVYECEDCGETGTLSYDAVTGMELSGCLKLQPRPNGPNVRRIRP
jgi:hypothetical protein